MKFLNAGFGNLICCDRIVSVASPEAAPIKRMVQDGKDDRRVIDISCGHKTKSVIFCDSDHIILSALTPEKIYTLLEGTDADTQGEAGE